MTNPIGGDDPVTDRSALKGSGADPRGPSTFHLKQRRHVSNIVPRLMSHRANKV